MFQKQILRLGCVPLVNQLPRPTNWPTAPHVLHQTTRGSTQRHGNITVFF
jgi:hypothetical protein